MYAFSTIVISLLAVNAGDGPSTNVTSFGHYDTANYYLASLDAVASPIAPPEMDLPRVEEKPSYAIVETRGAYCCEPACVPCPNPGFYGGGEATMLKPYFGSTCIDPPCFANDASYASENVFADFDHSAAPRLWLGYNTCSGLGFRIQWWQLNQTATSHVNFSTKLLDDRYVGDQVSSIGIEAIDFEVTDTILVGQKWNAMVSGGIRYANVAWRHSSVGEYDDGLGDPDSVFFERNEDFEGTGATAAIQLNRNVVGNFGLFANLRGSLLFGDSGALKVEEFGLTDLDTAAKEKDLVRSVWEAQLGVAWTREIHHGLYFTSRVAGEVQYWDQMVNSKALGLSGLTISAGFVR